MGLGEKIPSSYDIMLDNDTNVLSSEKSVTNNNMLFFFYEFSFKNYL